MLQEGEDIYVVSADLGAPSLDALRSEYPERFVNVGIAEQNLLSVAAGIAATGAKVVAYGLNPFPITRSYDQLRNFMNGLKIPISVVALNVGSCSAECGYTHMPIENFSILRSLANVLTVTPPDIQVAKMAARSLLGNVPAVIQFDKYITCELYQEREIDFNKGFVVKDDESEVTVISSGCFVNTISEISDVLHKEGVQFKRIDLYSTFVDEQAMFSEIKNSKRIITVEDGVLPGGMGSMILEILSNNSVTIPVSRLGLSFSDNTNDCFINRQFWYDDLGINKDNLMKMIRSKCLGLGE